MKPLSRIVLILSCFVVTSQGRVITLFLNGPNQTNEVVIQEYETVDLLSAWQFPSLGFSGKLYFEKNGVHVPYSIPFPGSDPRPPFTLAGPALVHLESSTQTDTNQSGGSVFATIEITPETYDVDRSITVGPGPGGAIISLECSH
jgi:hypothetical protein